jgi:outer membrane protein assembly factor BamB
METAIESANTMNGKTLRRSLRVWPGVAAVAVQWLALVVVPFLFPTVQIYGMLAGVAIGFVVLVWWLFFSRAAWIERIGALVLMVGAMYATKFFVHPSIENAGQGMMLFIFGIPVQSLALAVWAAATRSLPNGLRRASMVVAVVVACGVFTLVRTAGIRGDGQPDLHWRWTPTPEERLLAQTTPEATEAAHVPAPAAVPPPAPVEPVPPTAAKIPEKPAETVAAAPIVKEPPAIWPGFRGPNRNSVIRGVQIETDWTKSPPAEIWRKPIGPGWSSFAVRGDLIYTQEQRGEDEDVSCYRLTSGMLVWRHRDAARFWESNGGAGPRGTPTVSDGRVYTHGATGIVNALDANTGALLWTRNSSTDTGAKLPGWGFASSPLIVGDRVVVASSGRLVAYDIATGHPRWVRKTNGGGYSSPTLMTLDGVTQVVLQTGGGAMSVSPADGSVLWEHSWETGVAIVQPAQTGDDALLITGGDAMGGSGTRRLAVAHDAGKWTVQERWTTQGLKPYFNDYVVHNGHAYGFDNSILACISLDDGARKWKGGRYGHGQMVLLPAQDLLLVLSEEGDLALVKASPDQFTELAKIKAIEGKTWNHPALAGDVLLVRNGEEMAAFRLSLAGQ